MTTTPDLNNPLIRVLLAHVEAERKGDVETVLRTFGARAEFHDTAWDRKYVGHDAVRGYYKMALPAFARAEGKLNRIHVAQKSIVIEVTMEGTHTGDWHGIPRTGRRVSFPMCAVFAFDDENLLISETVYYDRRTVLDQLGVK